MRNLILIISFVLFSCKEDRRIIQNEISVNIGKKNMLDNNSLLIELYFNNNSETNYLLPISSDYKLENRKKIFNPVFGRIITSDFTDMNDYKIKFLLENYAEKYSYKGFSRESYKMAVYKDYEGYTNSLLFIPKKTKKRMFLIFNLYDSCNDDPKKCYGIFQDKLSKIKFDVFSKNQNTSAIHLIDSLLKENKLNYKIYNKPIYFIDSLLINK